MPSGRSGRDIVLAVVVALALALGGGAGVAAVSPAEATPAPTEATGSEAHDGGTEAALRGGVRHRVTIRTHVDAPQHRGPTGAPRAEVERPPTPAHRLPMRRGPPPSAA